MVYSSFCYLAIIFVFVSPFLTISYNTVISWQALDHVIVEARQQGIRLLFSLVNNLQAYGGKTQYVKWAWDEGVGLSASNDSFFFDPSIRNYFKNYVKVTFFVAFLPGKEILHNSLMPLTLHNLDFLVDDWKTI